MPENQGYFVISIDFEMYWGVRDVYSLDDYRRQYAGEREAISQMLKLFVKHGIHATWSVVGLLFFQDKKAALDRLPDRVPQYEDAGLSPYPYLHHALDDGGEEESPEHFAPSLIRQIQQTPHQRIGTHTFSHYYCQEEGQGIADFEADLISATEIAQEQGLKLTSLVFPRNQINEQYLPLLPPLGIQIYRGNPTHSAYERGYSRQDAWSLRLFRLLDTYFNLSGTHTYDLKREQVELELPMNIPASHFLRSASPRLKWLDSLRLKRILDGMTEAAIYKKVYHLWWHPYNLAGDQGSNMRALKQILEHYTRLHRKYGLQSASMEDLYEFITRAKDENR